MRWMLWPMAWMVACSGPGQAVVGTRTASEPLIEPTNFPEAPETEVEDSDLFYALYERVVEEVGDPNPFSDAVVDSETHSLKRLLWRAGEPVYTEQLCHTWGNEVFGTTWAFAEDFAEKRGLLERPVGGSDEGLKAGPYLDLLGTDVTEGDLPTDPDSPGVVDTDDDGNPGHTVYVTNDPLGVGEVYLAQRSTTSLDGTWLQEGYGSGDIDTSVEASTLQASTWWLAIPGPAGTLLPEKSFFVLQEVDPSVDCEAIFERRHELELTERPQN